jgi:hypothetical protein
MGLGNKRMERNSVKRRANHDGLLKEKPENATVDREDYPGRGTGKELNRRV